jgi:hypothetical protein
MVYLIGQGAQVAKRIVAKVRIESRKSLRITTAEEQELQRMKEAAEGGPRRGWPLSEEEEDRRVVRGGAEGAERADGEAGGAEAGVTEERSPQPVTQRCTLSNSECTPGKVRPCSRLREQVITCFFEELKEVQRQREEGNEEQDTSAVADTRLIKLCEHHYTVLLKFVENQQNTTVQRRKITTSAGNNTVRQKQKVQKIGT